MSVRSTPKAFGVRDDAIGNRQQMGAHFALCVPPSRDECFSVRKIWQLQLEKGAQTTEEGSAVFALFGRLILGEMSLFDNALRLHFSFCQQLTQLMKTFGRLANDFAHDWFADFQNVAVGGSADGGGAAFAGQERHFAEAIARMQLANIKGCSIFGH